MKKFEICVDSVQSALNAEMSGADRIELCDNLNEGGTTPSFGMIKRIKSLTKTIKTFVIIRPRGGDFLYSDDEIGIMLEDINQALHMGVDGIVSGALTEEGDIDIKSTKKLIQASKELPFTFHRAFDMCKSPFDSLEQLIDLGVTRILTSGMKQNAELGIQNISKMIDQAKDRIIIMPGSGISPDNIVKIAKESKANEFHFSARRPFVSKMNFINTEISLNGSTNKSDYNLFISDPVIIKQIISKIENTYV